MSQVNHRTRYSRKTRIAKNIIRDPELDEETKRLALQLLLLADDEGVIYNDDLLRTWKAMGLPVAEWGSDGR